MRNSSKMAAAPSEESKEDKSISMRVTLYGIRKSFPKVKQFQTVDLQKFIEGNKYKNLILLDVREQAEYDVSHLLNAIHVTPDEPVYQVMEKIKEKIDRIPDHHVKIVCYCSVGYRSAGMVKKLYPEFRMLKEAMKIDVTSELYNLEGSIFKWANEGKGLVDCKNMKTEYCHPYNYFWGVLLDSKLKSFNPVSNI